MGIVRATGETGPSMQLTYAGAKNGGFRTGGGFQTCTLCRKQNGCFCFSDVVSLRRKGAGAETRNRHLYLTHAVCRDSIFSTHLLQSGRTVIPLVLHHWDRNWRRSAYMAVINCITYPLACHGCIYIGGRSYIYIGIYTLDSTLCII